MPVGAKSIAFQLALGKMSASPMPDASRGLKYHHVALAFS
jgi:hypothetical protein